MRVAILYFTFWGALVANQRKVNDQLPCTTREGKHLLSSLSSSQIIVLASITNTNSEIKLDRPFNIISRIE